MQVTSKFSIGINTLLCMKFYTDKHKLTGDFLADKVGVNPATMRSIMSTLKNAGMIDTERGIGGATLVRKLKEITLLDVFEAFGCNDEHIFKLHNPNVNCPIGSNFDIIMNARYKQIEDAFLHSLQDVTLSEIYKDFKKRNKISKN